MDALTRRQFDRAMFAKERTLAIRVGDYASRDIKEASFEYGYIKGDTYKPGGTCAGSGKITFTSIITTFNKLDTLHPEIGLLVGDTYQWVKMGEYFINDIEIDRNRNTTTLELMDGMFKLNREYVTDLHFPAEVREVIQEICLKTGIELADDYFGISAMRYHIEQVPEGKKLSFRDMLSAMTQMIGMSCFFNREGKMEIRDLTESNITIDADSYFLHGLTKSEIEYQISGITCKTDKKSLTVGMKTGRSLELDNVFMTQSALNDLYYKLKNLTYYPYNLNYQGHLLLEVGQWVTIQTNKKETFKVPVLSQSFTFKGGLRGRISADSKAGNDTQYSYEGTITKQIKQQDGVEAKIQAQIEAADKDFDQKVDKIKKDFNDQVELAKARAEEVKRELSDTINQRFNSFDNGPLKEAKRKAEEALRNAGASSSLAQDSKRIGLDSVARLEAFKSQTTSAQTALSGDLDALKRTIANDIRPKQAQAETEIAKQVEALSRTKNELAGVKSAQATYEETTTRRLSELTNLANGKASKSELTQTAEELASKIASVKVGGRNYYRDSEKIRTSTRFFSFPLHPYLSQENVGETWTLSFDLKINEGGEIRPLLFYHYQTNRFGLKASADITPSKEWQRFTFTGPVIFPNDDPRYSRGEMALYDHGGNNNYSVRRIKLEKGTLATDWSPAPEDIEGQISTVESTFKQRANSLDAGVRSLTEGLRTKVDISALNVTAENIRQSVKSLETDTQNKLNQKLSQAEFEVRAGSIRQEILNATKDKADKTLVTAEAGKLREELTSLSVGENLFVNSDFKNLRDNGQRYTANGKTYQNMIAPYWYNPYNAGIPNAQNIQHGYFDTETFSDTVFAFNESDGSRHWKALSTDFKIGVISAGEYYFSADLYATDLGTHIKFGFYYHNSTGKLNFYAGRTKIEVTEKGRWTRLGIDLKVNDDIDLTKKVQFYIYGYNFASNSILYLKKPKVSKGRLKSDWSPALEDTEGLITEAKATFERTAQGLRTDLSAIQEYVNKNGQRQEALQRYTREESARQATAVRELVNRDFVGKATYQEDVKGINQRIEAVKTSANKDIASQIASYRQSVDGKFTDISSQITTYKQDVGGQISGLSNRLTSSEQGTTTQISNLSNRINSNKQGADNQISNLKTQVATNKDNAERQMGRISDQVSANKANADSQFANVTNQLARKVETTEFQRVKETSKLYERILGNTENGIADKVARMALTNQLFQVEVGKVAKGGRNYIRNGQFKNGSKNWLEYQSVNFGLNFNYQHSQNPNNRNRPGLHFYHDSQDVANFFGIQQSFAFDGIRGEKVSVSLLVSKDGGDSNSGLKVALHYIKNKNIIGQEWQNIPSPQITSKYKRFTFTFTLSDDVENLNLMLFGEKGKTINLYVTDVQLERGSVATDYKEAPEDTDEAIRSVQSQLTGSWAVQNINSAGDIISGINLGANGHNRFVGKLTHITGETLIDRAVIKSAMVDKLKTANFEAGSVTTTILDAEAVTADKVRFDAAFIRKMTANDAFIDQLTSGRIFSTKVESVISSSTFLEAYQGRIGGFTLGQFDQGGGRWISGVNQFSVGMGNGAGYGVRTAFWANWGNNWNYAGPKAWNVNTDGKMYCRNEVGFYDQVDFSNSSRANFYGNTTFSRSPVFSNGIELGSKDVLGDGWNPKGGRNAVVWWNQVGSGSLKYWMEQKSDRRLKENITDTAVKALDKINRLRMVAFDFIENKKHEEIGLIAQEAETIVPRIVSRDPENPDGYLHIDYTALVPYLIKAIQELNQKIEKMEKTIA
ncbi:phage hyaluronidase [Streptococcus pneumoniae]|nr:phage hyaluronidase [Streptococcus pneumoniae]VJU77974.1 phage hyaluronidase [Streptococcus pneumoniae]VOK87293.1 phage hyaluronidase [Streptococcus pneumoniae]